MRTNSVNIISVEAAPLALCKIAIMDGGCPLSFDSSSGGHGGWMAHQRRAIARHSGNSGHILPAKQQVLGGQPPVVAQRRFVGVGRKSVDQAHGYNKAP